jgi:hypothetical protein
MTLAFTDIPSTSTRALPLRNPSHLAAWRHPLKNQLHIRQALMQPGSSYVALSKLPNLNIAEYPSHPTKMCSSTSPAMLASCIQTMHPVGRGILKLFTGNRMKTTWSDLFQLHPIANQMSFSDCGPLLQGQSGTFTRHQSIKGNQSNALLPAKVFHLPSFETTGQGSSSLCGSSCR